MKSVKLLLTTLALCVPVAGFSAGLPWYAGVVGGASSLRPDTENSPFTLDSDVSFGAGAFVGYDLTRRFSLELGYNYLGQAILSSDSGDTEIGYSALSGSALMYLLGNANNIADRSGFAGYVRLGVSAMDNAATIPLEREDNAALLAGVGFEWPFSNSLSMRGELESFDGDAQAARVSVLYRPRVRAPRGTLPSRPTQAPQVPQAPQAPQAVPAPSSRTQPSAPSQPAVAVADSNCSTPVAGEPADARGCGAFSGKIRGVEFTSGTATLTPIGSQLLDRLAQNLLRYPNIVIEIQAHTESFGSEAKAKQIATQRALAVARHIAGRGVPVQRLRARAFGHTQPVSVDGTTAGRRLNNRIVLRVLR